MKRGFDALPAFLMVVSFWLVASSEAAEGVTADVCPQKLATIARLKNELRITRITTKDHDARLEGLKKSRGEAGKHQVATEAAKVAKPRYAWLSNVGTVVAAANVNKVSVEIEQTESLIRISKEKETSLAKELALEESLAPKCLQQAAAAAAAKPALPVLTGAYNSPYGHTELTQTGAIVNGAVKYDVSPEHPRGGTNTLTGSFDGRIYHFDWRDSYMRNGSGQLTVLPDGTGLKGWWEDKTANPPKRENWWLYRK